VAGVEVEIQLEKWREKKTVNSKTKARQNNFPALPTARSNTCLLLSFFVFCVCFLTMAQTNKKAEKQGKKTKKLPTKKKTDSHESSAPNQTKHKESTQQEKGKKED
jgi:hypothetical protein